MSSSLTGSWPFRYWNPPLISLNAAKSKPKTESGNCSDCTTTPVTAVTCGCCISNGRYFSLNGAPLRLDITDDPVGRTITSAPTALARFLVESSVPWLTPTSVRIMVTSTAIASTLSSVRTGRWVRLAKISLFSTALQSIPTSPFGPWAPIITASPPRLECGKRILRLWLDRMDHARRRPRRRTALLPGCRPRRLPDHHPATPPHRPLPHYPSLLHRHLGALGGLRAAYPQSQDARTVLQHLRPGLAAAAAHALGAAVGHRLRIALFRTAHTLRRCHGRRHRTRPAAHRPLRQRDHPVHPRHWRRPAPQPEIGRAHV